ncbi:MAG: ribbon-helix-helix protein, CopG family [Methylocella sp.]|jgi:ribbon-helix-helix CopG family protein
MSLASERLVIPITAKDKARVERKAAMEGRLSTAEFVRRAALNYEPADEAAAVELRGLVSGFEELHANTLAQLDRTDAALDAALAHFNRDRARAVSAMH